MNRIPVFIYLLLTVLLSACAHQNVPKAPSRPELVSTREENYQAKIHTELAGQYFLLRQYAVALQELNFVVGIDPRHAPAYDLLGLVHAELGEGPEAEKHFRRAIELSPQYSEARSHYGSFLCKSGRVDEALSQFDTALKNPLYAAPEATLAEAGRCVLKQGNLAGAESFLQRALARAPQLPTAVQTMADLQMRLGNPIAARSRLMQLQDLGELDAPALWLAVRVERQLGNREAEGSYAAQLRKRFPESRETRWLFNGQFDQTEAQ